ncbi:hypothetical protein UlMin_009489 [Ulmus minor]
MLIDCVFVDMVLSDDDDDKPEKRNRFFYNHRTLTEPADSHNSTFTSSGQEVEVGDADESLQCTSRLDDTVMVEDVFETQVILAGETQAMDFGDETEVENHCDETQAVNLGGETQAMDFGSETQVVNNCDETQALDDFYIEDVETQLVDAFHNEVVGDSDSEGTDNTEVLGDSDEVSDDELISKGADKSVDKGQGQLTSLCKYGRKELMKQPSVTRDENRNSGFQVPTAANIAQSPSEPKSGSMRFASLHAAALRASGLAARSLSLKSSCSLSSSIPTTMKSGKEVDQERDLGKSNNIENLSGNETKLAIRSFPARKLFTEDTNTEYKELPDDTSGEDGEDLPDCDLAGLSYLESQEPGELSQANALEFVDRFLGDAIVELDMELDQGKSSGGNSKCVPSVKGPQKLAKKAIDKAIVREIGIYDWDDSREDEGGGDIFQRRKEDFLSGGSLGRKASKLKANGLEEEQRDHKDQLNSNCGNMGSFNSDSKLLSHRLKVGDKTVHEAERNSKRNLMNELETEFECAAKRSEDNANMSEVGFDTQMAAEAMEALLHGEDIPSSGVSDGSQDVQKGSDGSHKGSIGVNQKTSSRKRACLYDAGLVSSKSKKTRRVGAMLEEVSLVSSEKQSKNSRKQCDSELVTKRLKKAKSNAKEKVDSNGRESFEKMPHKVIKETDGSRCHGTAKLSRDSLQNKQDIKGKSCSSAAIPRRTTRSMVVSCLENSENVSRDCRDETNNTAKVAVTVGKRNKIKGVQEMESVKPNQHEHVEKMEALPSCNKIDAESCPKRRSSRNLSCQVNEADNLGGPLEPSAKPKGGQNIIRKKRSTRSSTSGQPFMSSVELNAGRKLSEQRNKLVPGDAESMQTIHKLDESPKVNSKPSDSLCITPVNHTLPITEASPECMGNDYFKKSCKRSLSGPSLLKEIRGLSDTKPLSASPSKDLRKRREMTDVRVLYSRHMDEDTIKHQKKILARLGISMASSITDATHFIADEFVRTRNMLEAIATGKPVVTHLWLDSCGQAKCFIDEKNFILRDAKKEKEIGFNMPASLACARRCPLLEGLRILVTPNTKPSMEIISSLVKAVHGQAIERIGRSAMKEDKIPDDLLILSCEEDYAFCEPFLEKGAAIYSSELLLNGIVTQKLEYERYQLFTDHVRKTRSSIFLRKHGKKFLPVTN